MTLLDAYALVAFLIGGPAAPRVRGGLLREGDAVVATANLAEVLDVSQRIHGLPIHRSMEIVEPLFAGTLGVVALDLSTARRAADIRVRHYHRARSTDLSLADAVLLASAGPGDRIATADPDVLAVAAQVGIATVVLASQG